MADKPAAYLAIDIGGTKVACAVVDARGAVHERTSLATSSARTGGALFDAVVKMAGDVRDRWGDEVAACGVGCGGPMHDDVVSPLNIPVWRDFPLRASLAGALSLRVSLDNDAKALALAEGWLGAAASSSNFIAMVVSTGVGGGIVLNDHLLEGRLGNAGHVGHVIVIDDGHPCACGGHGCLEAEASGPSIERATGRPASDADDVTRTRTGRLVGRAVASVSSLLDLDLAVVGGSVALGFGAPFFEAAQAELSARARLDFSKDCRIVPVGLGDAAPLIGAAALAMRHDRAAWISA